MQSGLKCGPTCLSDDELRLRTKWKVEAPRLGHAPRWLRPRVTAAIKAKKLPRMERGSSGTSFWALMHAADCMGRHWLDHYGTLKVNGVDVLISEPYGLSGEACRQLHEFCRILDLQYLVSPRSWWYPNYTIRIVVEVPR